MYHTQITIENTTIWFSLSLRELDLCCLKVFVKRTCKGPGMHIENTH